MRIGVPKEIKDHEDRVGLVPSSVTELVHHGHQVLVERGAGLGAGLADEDDHGGRGVEPHEALDHAIAILLRDARPTVADFQQNPRHVVAAAHRDRPVRRVAERVRDQVADDLPQRTRRFVAVGNTRVIDALGRQSQEVSIVRDEHPPFSLDEGQLIRISCRAQTSLNRGTDVGAVPPQRRSAGCRRGGRGRR